MRLSRDWLGDYVALSDLSDEELASRFTEIGHAVDAMERHGDDTVFDLEITTNRVDAMSHLGMARELAAALGRDLQMSLLPAERAEGPGSVSIRIDAPQMCSRYTGKVIRGVTIRPSPEKIRRRLEAAGLRPINNVVDVTNYVMLALGHPLHGFDLDKLAGAAIIVRAGNRGETIKSLDGEVRRIDPETVVIADAKHSVALGGIMGGAQSEIGQATRNVLLECAWFEPSVIRRTARRLGMKTDASYRFERRVDPNDTVAAVELAARLIVESAGGTPEPVLDLVAAEHRPLTLRLRAARLAEASAGVVGIGYALDLFRRIGFEAEQVADGIEVSVPAFRGDIHEEMDLIEEVLRFFGLDKVPSSLPRLTTGDARPNAIGETEDEVRRILTGCGLTEVVNYSFIRPEQNALFSNEKPLDITNALSENITSMRLSLLPGLLETVVFNRSYGTRDGALFEVGRTYHQGVREAHRAALVLYGTLGTHWGEAKRAVDFFDVKGIVEQVAAKLHVELAFAPAGAPWLRPGKGAAARHGDRTVATLGFLAPEVLQHFGIKGEVAAAEVDLEALRGATGQWKMAPVARFPGVPMILALTHGGDVDYGRLIEMIRSLEVPYLHDVGLRDRYVPEGADEVVKTTLGMWYQAFDRSLTQEEVSRIHQELAARIAGLLPVKVLGSGLKT
ncbi:MAG TPA: phenylalanine--tRNA ligase subunit beta [Thermoanaerobaculia bacterium]|nr:phenylalanine--tRNA ligase subunit beta [Thermoanaerobaculia bacterium]